MSKCKYKVSIAVPVYGVEAYVEKCAESLFSQTYLYLYLGFQKYDTATILNLFKS